MKVYQLNNKPSHTNLNFNQLVADHFSQLTKSEKRIADFMLRHQDEAAFLLAGEIAERLGLSEATMVRFARKLDFDSYPALREALQENFRHRMTHSARLRSRLENLREVGDIFEQLVASEIDYLTESLQTLSREALNKAVELLHTHRRIFVFGLGPSISLVDLLEIRLTRAARQVIPLKTSGQEMLEPMLLMDKDDLLIAIGFFNLTPMLEMVLAHAQKRQVPVILVTDTLGELLKDKVDVILAARRGPVSAFHSLTVPMTVVNTMLLMLSSMEQENVMAHLDVLDQLREKLRNAGDAFQARA
jgi:DNA-binding MurR/RpiR family transcriptional regulator